MGGVETSRDGGATQEITKVVLVELTLNSCGGGRMPRWGKYKGTQNQNLHGQKYTYSTKQAMTTIACTCMYKKFEP